MLPCEGMMRLNLTLGVRFGRILAVLAVMATSPSHAEVIDWVGGASGGFSDESSWADGKVPGSADTANFATAGAVSVSLSGNVTIDNLTYNMVADPSPPVVPPNLTINLNGFQLSSGIANTNPFSLGNSGTEVRTLTLLGNGVYNVSQRLLVYELKIGPADNPAPGGFNLVLDDAAGLRGNRNSGHVIGDGSSTVSIQVLGGSELDLNGQSQFAVGSASNVSILVSGKNSTFRNSNSGSIRYHNFGISGTAVVTIEDGARYISNAFSSLGHNSAGRGEIYISGTGSSFTLARGLYVGGGLNTDNDGSGEPFLGIAGGAGIVSLSDHATMTLGGPPSGGQPRQGLLHVMAANPDLGRYGQVILDGTVTLTTDHARFEEGSVLRIGLQDTEQAPNLIVIEDLTLINATLEVWLPTGLTPELGQSFALIQYGELTGTFGNENGEITIDGHRFQIDYSLDGANIVGLVAIPEPTTIALLIGGMVGLAVLLLRRRRA